MKDYYRRDFPFDAFPALIRDALHEMEMNFQAPRALIGSSALGAISLACQSVVDVLRPNMLEASPVSLFLITVADSGERKSSVDKQFMRPIFEFERAQEQRYQLKNSDYEAVWQVWSARHKAILAAIKKNTKKELSTDQLKQELASHLQSKPQKSRRKKMVYTDATPEAIIRGLHDGGASAGIMSDEAGDIFKGRAISSLAMFNKAWGGDTFTVDRCSSESFSVENPRLTISLMAQTKVVTEFMARHGNEARDIGFLARTLICFPASTQGARFIEDKTPSWEHLPIFQNRMAEILNLEKVEGEKNILKFSPEGATRWIQIFNKIETRLNPGRYFSDMKDYASKYAENLARVAAILHFFCGFKGDISDDMVSRAERICEWYADEFKENFAKPEIPIEELDAKELERWLQRHVQETGNYFIRKNDIRKFGPNSLRSKERLDAALDFLEFTDKIRFSFERKVKYVDMNPDYFSDRNYRR